MPVVPIETPSETEIVLNSIGVPPAARMPSFTCRASARWFRLHGIVSIHVVATPTSGFARSSSVKPTAFSIARAGARSTPSVSAALRRLAGSVGCVVDAHAASAPWLGDARAAGPARRREGGASSAAATVGGAGRFSAQTTTDGPEPESVTPAVPVDRARAQLAEQRRVGDAVRLVQPVVERGARAARRRRRRSPRRAARPARRRRRRRAWRHGRGQPRCATRVVFTRVSGTTTIARERQVGREPRGAWAGAVAPDQADAAAERGARLSACPSSGRPSASSSSRRGVAPGDRGAGDEPGAIVAALEPSPRSSGMRLTKRSGSPRPARRARTRAARGARRRAAARRRPRPRASTAARRRPSSTSQLVPEVERGRGAVEPGPEVGRRRGRDARRSRHDATSRGSPRASARRRSSRPAARRRRAVSFRPWPVRTQTTVLPGSSSTLRERREARRRDDGSQKTPSRLASSSHASRDLLVGDRDDLDAAVGDELVDLVARAPARRSGSRRRASSRARPPAPTTSRGATPVLGEALRVRATCCRRRRRAARARRARGRAPRRSRTRRSSGPRSGAG